MSDVNERTGTVAATLDVEGPVWMSHRGITKHGFLVLADISGFTAFVTETELEHGPPIIAALLEAVIRHIAPPLEVQEIEGDAVFALGLHGTVVPPSALFGVFRAGLASFRDLQREMQRDDSCSCNACQSIGRLRLKIIGHYGTFLRQTVGGHAQVAGKDVILAHCLLKNHVPRRMDYALLTRPALRYMGIDPTRAGLASHVERYEHFGEVEYYVGEI
jgi:hypothetical protein